MDEILVANFMVFHDSWRDEPYDLWIGDEAWELDYFLHENPELKTAAYVWLTDFVGWLPMPDGGEHEAFLTADYNAEMIEHIERHRASATARSSSATRTTSCPAASVPDLPMIRDWTEEHFDFAGYVTGFDPVGPADREALRAELGYGDDERVCIVDGRRLGRRRASAAPGRRGLSRGQAAGARPADDRRRRPAHRSRVAAARGRARGARRTSTTSTATSPPATSPSSRAG